MCILGMDTPDKPAAPCSGQLCFYTLPELFGLCWHFWKSAPVLWKMQTPFEKWHLHPSEHRRTERGREEMGIPTSAGVWHSPDFFQSANNSQSIFKISRCILNWPRLHSCSRLCCHTTDQSTGENPHPLLSDKQKRAHPWWTQTVKLSSLWTWQSPAGDQKEKEPEDMPVGQPHETPEDPEDPPLIWT